VTLFADRPEQVLVRPHPVAVAADVDDVAVVPPAVDQRCGHDLVAEHATLLEAPVSGEDRGGPLVAGVDQTGRRARCRLG